MMTHTFSIGIPFLNTNSRSIPILEYFLKRPFFEPFTRTWTEMCCPRCVQVNHSPSFHTDARLDKEIKEALIYDTLNILGIACTDKRKCMEEEKRRVKERLFQRQNKKEIRCTNSVEIQLTICMPFMQERNFFFVTHTGESSKKRKKERKKKAWLDWLQL